MTIQIVHRGTLPAPTEKKYVGTCRNCRTVITCVEADVDLIYDQRDGDYRLVTCPVCSHRIYVKEDVEQFTR